jgi:acyl-CoA synthetase (AMP-forming)/AMP-acid ligase II
LTAATIREGWLRTGDLARFDADGYLFIEGRIKDLIHSGGLKFSPREVEDVILLYPGVREVSVVPVSHPVKGEVAKTYIVADRIIKPAKLREFCRERLADYKIPRQWEQVENLPKLASGKVARRSVTQS